MEKIVFVDENDNIISSGTKREAWDNGIIHRIVRVLVFNSKDEILIQKRSEKMELFPGKWDQSAGGHVDEGESYQEAAHRELLEEMGINSDLEEIGYFFQDEKEKNLNKKRFNKVYKTIYNNALLKIDKEEVSEVKWIKLQELKEWMKKSPDDFTGGFIVTMNFLNV